MSGARSWFEAEAISLHFHPTLTSAIDWSSASIARAEWLGMRSRYDRAVRIVFDTNDLEAVQVLRILAGEVERLREVLESKLLLAH